MRIFFKIIFYLNIILLSTPVFARCAVCYTNGLSGASIAVIVIIFSALFLFFANKLLKKILEKTKV
tara:strand:- start:2374 stop:2571 length:198 start_codon:yes stop_codon:yes gene_type:complete